MRFKSMFVFLIIAGLVFAGGCTKRAEPGVVSPFYGSSEGLIAQFEEIGSLVSQGGYPEVWEDQGIPVTVMLYNRGEFNVPSASIELSIKGISQQDFSGIEFLKTNDAEIEKVSEFLPDGGEARVEFGEAHYVAGVKGTFYDANIFVEYTYPYEQTIIVPKVCFKGDPLDDTICSLDETKQAYISGGPFQIGTVIQRPAGKGRITLEIPIKNVAGGRAKAGDDPLSEFNKLYDEVLISPPEGWVCSAKGMGERVRITAGGETVIRCRYGVAGSVIPESDVYTSAFDMKVNYIYWDFVSQTVRIRENPELG